MQRLFVAALVTACLALSAAFVRAGEKAEPASGKVPDIEIKDLNAAIDKKQVTVIDVNGTDSFRDGHIPGAIDFEANEAKIEKLLPKDKDALVVAYCGGPQCTAYQAAAKKAVALGYSNVKHLPAGISGWKAAGEKLEKADAKAS